ncbi:MAG: hypothetical protein HZA93_24115 [Verrucomicrobia bacterium]|nr:hypothetical protein [Verrucomicrobiota bacterium]
MSDTLETTEAALCVERIVAFQAEHSLSDVELTRRFPELGSARTWRTRLAAQQWEEAPVATWLPRLQAVVAKIEGRAEAGEVAEGGLLAGVPTAFVTRHLTEADRCRREANFPLARSHCRAAAQAIKTWQRNLTAASAPQTPAPKPETPAITP